LLSNRSLPANGTGEGEGGGDDDDAAASPVLHGGDHRPHRVERPGRTIAYEKLREGSFFWGSVIILKKKITSHNLQKKPARHNTTGGWTILDYCL